MTVSRQTIRPIAIALAFFVLALSQPAKAAAGDGAVVSASGLPGPRYVSLKSERGNVHTGPTKDHDVAWVFTKQGLPVEVTAEFENWRRIRDAEGAEGWVYHSMLSGRRTAVVTARDKDQLVGVLDNPAAGSDVTAQLQPGVLTSVKRCDGHWCRVIGKQFDGWV